MGIMDKAAEESWSEHLDFKLFLWVTTGSRSRRFEHGHRTVWKS
jgi:hypothetical protein